MRKLLLTTLWIIVIIPTSKVFGQPTKDSLKAVVSATNFSLPSSIAFNLLDINPTQVYRPGFAKDFKFDWVVKDNKIASNLAIEAQPVWLFFYNDTDYNEFSKNSYLEKIFSSLTVSIGTSTKESIHSLAWGAKVNLYAKANPIYDTSYIKKVSNFEAKREVSVARDSIEFEMIDTTINPEKMKSLRRAYDSLNNAYSKDSIAHFAKLGKLKEDFEKANWNTTIIDVGYGQVYNYLSQSIDSLSFQNNGSALWISGNFGIGTKILINGMFKYSTVSGNNITTIGANCRYGGLNSNFFIEALYNNASNDKLKTITIAYGGEFKINDTIALQFGLRTDYTNDLKFKNLIPIVNFNYLLVQ
ncbi:MAG: hypothetical protein SFU91_11975 [Chloroherpetonaceae bacterium]|nr:hypothetical protein [Chloroherpetonaceae bacterium]